MASFPTSTRAIVTNPPKDGNLNWSLQNAKIRDPQADELLVRVVASGICHTDLVMSMMPEEFPMANYPKILGHEGSGVVEKVGSDITHTKPGDLVLLSFNFCGKSSCHGCKSNKPGYCGEFLVLNMPTHPGFFKLENGEVANGSFFGQSSFANYAIVKTTSALNVSGLVKDEEELKLFAPFGCGFQTGAGAVTELANASEQDAIAVFGLGGVGMLAIMAAKLRGAHTIIAVDRFQSRLDIAKSVGATHTINTSDFQNLAEDLTKAIKNHSASGVNIVVEATGVLGLAQGGMQALAPGGQLIIIGIPVPGTQLQVDLSDMLSFGKTVRGCLEGDAVPSKYVPQLIQWYREGKLPIEKLVQHYKVEEFGQALGDMHSGSTIKAILLW